MTIEKDGCREGSPNCIEEKRNWNNCVVWGETGSGKHDDWCRNDFGPNWAHVGQDGAGCAKGWGKGVCRKFMYRGPNCDDANSDDIWDGVCDGHTDTIFPNLNTKRKEYCNSNIGRARSDKCSNWCNAHGGQCGLKDRLSKCQKYNIGDNECSDAKITEIENKCVNMGFIDQTTKSSIGGAQCNQSSIDNFLKECDKLIPAYMNSRSQCTSTGLADAKSRKLIADNAEQSRLQAAKDAEAARQRQAADTERLIQAQKASDQARKEELEKTSKEQIEARMAAQKAMEQTLLSVVDPDSLPEELKPKVPKSYTTMYIIIAVFLLLSSSGILSSFLMM